MDDRVGRWAEGPLLPAVAPPPPHLVEVNGAKLVLVFDPPGTRRVDGGRHAVCLARARMPRGGWALLLAWSGYWVVEDPPHQTGKARWAWCLYDPDRVRPHAPPGVLYEGAAWHGWHEESQLHVAVLRAVQTLPAHLRAAALTPAAHQGPAAS